MPDAEQPARLAEVGLEELQRQIAESEGSPRPQGRRVGLGLVLRFFGFLGGSQPSSSLGL